MQPLWKEEVAVVKEEKVEKLRAVAKETVDVEEECEEGEEVRSTISIR